MNRRCLIVSVLLIIALQVLILSIMGRLWVCDCESIRLWYGNAYGPENSQQFFDPYSLSHVVHGLIFFLILNLFEMPMSRRLLLAMGLEVGWEILENTPMTIERYRTATVSLGYYGDTILNSVVDTVSMMLGFLLASRMRTLGTLLTILVIEVVMLFWIQDNLLLNIIMLIHPFDFILQWQQGM